MVRRGIKVFRACVALRASRASKVFKGQESEAKGLRVFKAFKVFKGQESEAKGHRASKVFKGQESEAKGLKAFRDRREIRGHRGHRDSKVQQGHRGIRVPLDQAHPLVRQTHPSNSIAVEISPEAPILHGTEPCM